MRRNYLLRRIYFTALSVNLSFIPSFGHAQTVEWVRQLGTFNDDYANGISTDSMGNVYLTGDTGGSLGGPNSGNVNGFLTKYSAAGSVQWSRQFGTNYSFGMAVSADQPGSTYVSGFTSDRLGATSGSGEDAFLVRYDVDGIRLWTQQSGTAAIDRSYGVAADDTNIFIGGWTTGNLGDTNAGRSEIFVSKYNTSGALQWSRQLGTTGIDECSDISADGNGNVYLAGYTDGNLNGPNAGSLDGFVGKVR